jgi:hypothetical protein
MGYYQSRKVISGEDRGGIEQWPVKGVLDLPEGTNSWSVGCLARESGLDRFFKSLVNKIVKYRMKSSSPSPLPL